MVSEGAWRAWASRHAASGMADAAPVRTTSPSARSREMAMLIRSRTVTPPSVASPWQIGVIVTLADWPHRRSSVGRFACILTYKMVSVSVSAWSDDASHAVLAVDRLDPRRRVERPADRLPAVDADHLAGDPRRAGTRQERHDVRDVSRAPQPRQDDSRPEVVLYLVRQFLAIHLNQAGPDDVHAHVARSEFAGCDAAQLVDGGLGARDGTGEPGRQGGTDRRDRDEAPATRADQRPGRVLQRQHGGHHVVLEDAVPAVQVKLGNRGQLPPGLSRARDGGVQPAAQLAGRFDGAPAGILTGQVGRVGPDG